MASTNYTQGEKVCYALNNLNNGLEGTRKNQQGRSIYNQITNIYFYTTSNNMCGRK